MISKKKKFLLFFLLFNLFLTFIFLINFNYSRIIDRVYENFYYLLISSLIAVISANFLLKKKLSLSLIFFIFCGFFSLFSKNIVGYLEFLGTDSFDATQKTNFAEIKFFISTIKDLFIIQRINIYIFFVASISFLFCYLLSKFLDFKIAKYNNHLLGLILILFFGFIFRVSFIAETPNTLFKKVTKNFDNNFISQEFSQNNVNLFIHIGESTSSMNWSLYKYFRNTNPKLSELEKDKLLIFRDVFSTHTHTTPSLLDAFSFDLDNDSNEDFLTVYEKKKINVFEILKFHNISLLNLSNSFGNFEYTVLFNEIETISNLNHPFQENEFFLKNLDLIKKRIDLQNQKTLTLIHSYVGHGPYRSILSEDYQNNVDNFFKKFFKKNGTIFLKEIFGNKKDALNASLNNIEEYDSAMMYLDNSIFNLIEKFENFEEPIVYIFFADHGESVYTNKGHDSSRFVYEMATVPLVMYFNSSARNQLSDLYSKYLNLSKSKTISTLQDLPPTILDILGIKLKNKVSNSFILKEKERKNSIKILNRKTLKGRSYIELNYKNDFSSNNKSKELTPEYVKIYSLHHAYPTKKVCYHRANSISKIIRAISVTNCFETDLNILNDNFEIFHSPEKSSKLNIDDIFVLSKNYDGNIWIDIKDFYSKKNCKVLAQKLNDNFDNQKILLEFSNGMPDIQNLNCFNKLKQKGFQTAFQIETDRLEECKNKKNEYKCNEFFNIINSREFIKAFTHLAINGKFKDFIDTNYKINESYLFALWGLDTENYDNSLLLKKDEVDYVIYNSSADPNSIE